MFPIIVIQKNNTQLLKTQSYSDAFEKIIKPNEYVTYSLRLNSYSTNTPYFKYFIINKEISGVEKAGFVKYIPSTPTYTLDVDNFTGDIEIYTIENELFAKTTFLNGAPVTNNLNKGNNNTILSCVNSIYIIVHPCSHGGGHLPGESCNNGLANDAYFEIRTSQICDYNIKYIAPPGGFGGNGGEGGGGGSTILNALNIPIPYEGEPSFDNPSYMYYVQILNFLKANSVYNNLLSNNYANANLLNDWLVPAVVDYFRNNEFNQQNQINVIDALNTFNQFLPLESNEYNFEEMLVKKHNAFVYLLNNPGTTFEQYTNWFLGRVEGRDSFYNDSFWQNPNLNFPQQQLPTWNNFNNSFPRNSDGTFMTGADNVFGYVGGPVLQARIDNPDTTNNTCALKLSIALNGSGVVIPNIPGQTLQGGVAFAGKFFFLNAKTLNNWMKLTFGTNPTNPNHHKFTQNQGGTNGEGFISALNNLSPNHGIFTMLPISAIEFGASGHCDIFDGVNCASHCYFDSANEINIWILQ